MFARAVENVDSWNEIIPLGNVARGEGIRRFESEEWNLAIAIELHLFA